MIITNKNKYLLTKLDLSQNTNDIVDTFLTVDSPDGLNMMNTGLTIRCVIKVGQINDWALYCANDLSLTAEQIAAFGDKAGSMYVQNIVDMSEEVLNAYRD